MKHHHLKLFTLTASLFAASQLQANNNIEVTPLQEVTQQELAALYVLTEICPNFVSNQDQFNQGYQRFLTTYLPKTQNPLEQLKHLGSDESFQTALIEARADAKQAGDAQNIEICKELSTYTP